MFADFYAFQPNAVVRLLFDNGRNVLVNELGDCFAADSRQHP